LFGLLDTAAALGVFVHAVVPVATDCRIEGSLMGLSNALASDIVVVMMAFACVVVPILITGFQEIMGPGACCDIATSSSDGNALGIRPGLDPEYTFAIIGFFLVCFLEFLAGIFAVRAYKHRSTGANSTSLLSIVARISTVSNFTITAFAAVWAVSHVTLDNQAVLTLMAAIFTILHTVCLLPPLLRCTLDGMIICNKYINLDPLRKGGAGNSTSTRSGRHARFLSLREIAKWYPSHIVDSISIIAVSKSTPAAVCCALLLTEQQFCGADHRADLLFAVVLFALGSIVTRSCWVALFRMSRIRVQIYREDECICCPYKIFCDDNCSRANEFKELISAESVDHGGRWAPAFAKKAMRWNEEEMYAANHYRVLAIKGNKVVGGMLFRHHKVDGVFVVSELLVTVVNSACRGSGVGSQIWDYYADFLRRQDCIVGVVTSAPTTGDDLRMVNGRVMAAEVAADRFYLQNNFTGLVRRPSEADGSTNGFRESVAAALKLNHAHISQIICNSQATPKCIEIVVEPVVVVTDPADASADVRATSLDTEPDLEEFKQKCLDVRLQLSDKCTLMLQNTMARRDRSSPAGP
jgi:hypothetical protein